MATAGCAHSAHVPFLLMEEEAEEAGSPPEAGLLERLLSCWAPNHRSAGCPWDATHGAVTQPGERVTDGTVSMPRTPLNFPHGRQMKLPLYFTTLQVTETQLPPPLTRFHPPEFRSLPCLSELPGLFSLLSPRGEPARANHYPCSPELTYLNVSALPGRPWCRAPQPPCWGF